MRAYRFEGTFDVLCVCVCVSACSTILYLYDTALHFHIVRVGEMDGFTGKRF